jgi:hypothetical protein
VAGKLQFNKPNRRGPGDPWFTVNGFDVTTSVLLPAIVVVVWVLQAIYRPLLGYLFLSVDSWKGPIWQIVTWPLASFPQIGEAIGLFFFWSIGRMFEERLGRVGFLRFVLTIIVFTSLLALTIGNVVQSAFPKIPGLRTTFTDIPFLFGPSLLGLALAVAVCFEQPGLRSFFGLPFAAIVAVVVAIEVLQLVGDRAWSYLLTMFGSLLFTVAIMKAFGLGSVLNSRFPSIGLPGFITGRSQSGLRRNGSSSGSKRSGRGSKASGRGSGRSSKGKGGGSVVSGPWGESGTGTANRPAGSGTTMSRSDREEVDRLLDKIAVSGMESLTAAERASLDEASRRLRDSGNR